MGKATLKIVQKYEVNADGKYVVRLRITASRKSRYVASSVEVAQAQFNPKGKRESTNWIRSSHPNAEIFNKILKDLWDSALAAIDAAGSSGSADEIKGIIEKVHHKDEFSPATPEPAAIDELPGFIKYCDFYIGRRGEGSTTDTYIDAKKAFTKYLASLPETGVLTEPEVSFEALTISFLKSWRTWALRKYANNTVWLYHSRLKSMYFQAVEDFQDLAKIQTVVTDPFRRVKIKKIKTKKRRLYEDEMDRFAALDLPFGSPLRQIRDICLMMYYAQGMRVGDALRLRAKHYIKVDTYVVSSTPGESKPQLVVQHRLIYQMQKGKKAKNALLPQQAIDLLEPYLAATPSPEATIFTFLRKEIDAGYTPYAMRLKVKSKVANIKMRLVDLMTLAQIDKSISAHVFRHSFADLARRNNMDWLEIQKAMGHERFSTTEVYMEELDESSADNSVNLFSKGSGKQSENNSERKQA